MIWQHGTKVLEALLFAAPEPLSAQRIGEIIGIGENEVAILVRDLDAAYTASDRALAVRAVAGGFQLVTRPEMAEWVEKLLTPKSRGLSRAALETLAIIAYRQPITRGEIEAVRGVKVDSSLETLLERGLIREVGRREGVGRPLLFGTTPEFLGYFGLKDLAELPELEDGAVEDLFLFAGDGTPTPSL